MESYLYRKKMVGFMKQGLKAENAYKLIILDMDGTLYFQRKMQFLMLLEMMHTVITRPKRVKELLVIKKFRETHERDTLFQGQDILKQQYRAVKAYFKDLDEDTIENFVDEWMFKRPLKYISRCKDERLCGLTETWKNQGKHVVVYSDYPAKHKCEKLNLLGLDEIVSSDSSCIGEMKPSAKGVEYFLNKYNVKREEVLVIGDRDSKDGEMARSAGVAYVLVSKWRLFRRIY